MPQRLNPKALALASAIVSAFIMLLLGIFGNLGIYTGAVQQMQKWHLIFSLSILGIVGGMIESAVISFVIGYLFALIYNRFM
jgi:hypothetical protein